jgi:acetaldehyde dehydrogenase (acetylating)
VLSYYVVKDWREGCERCIEILDFGGAGHTLTIHSRNEEIIWQFAFEKPTHRILVNTPASHGAVGLSTWLLPSMTLGCGAFGGNITSDNISAQHLMLVKRLAWGKPGFVEEEAKRRKERDLAAAPAAARAAPPSFHGSAAAFRPWPMPPARRS